MHFLVPRYQVRLPASWVLSFGNSHLAPGVQIERLQLWLWDTWEVIRETVAWGEGGTEAVEKSVRQGVSRVTLHE